LRAHVPVNDVEGLSGLVPLFVRIVQSLAGFGDDPGRNPRGDPRTLRLGCAHQMAEIAPLHVFHGQEEAIVPKCLKFIDLNDVRMIEPCRETRLFDEHGSKAPRAAVHGQDSLQYKDLVGPFRPHFFRKEHFGHPAGPKPANKLELRDFFDGRRGGRFGHQAGTDLLILYRPGPPRARRPATLASYICSGT
jgi:hypothetical protein